MQPFLDGDRCRTARSRRREGHLERCSWCAKRYHFEERLRHYVRVARQRADAGRAEGEARRAAHAALAPHVDVAGRPQVGAVDEHRLECTSAFVRDLGPGAAREHDRVAARSVVARRDHQARATASTRSTARGSSSGPSASTITARSTSSPSAARPQRSEAPGPTAQSSHCTSRAPGASSSCAPCTTTISVTLVWRSATSTAGSSSRCLTPPYRVEAPAASTSALADVDGRLLELDGLGRDALAARRGIAELADRFHDRQALQHSAEHGVVRRQLRVGRRHDEELAARRTGRLGGAPSPSRPGRACTSSRRAAGRPSCSPGRPCPSPVGSPPCIDEAWDDAVEDRVVEEALLHEAHERRGCRRRSLHGEANREAAAARDELHVIRLRRRQACGRFRLVPCLGRRRRDRGAAVRIGRRRLGARRVLGAAAGGERQCDESEERKQAQTAHAAPSSAARARLTRACAISTL